MSKKYNYNAVIEYSKKLFDDTSYGFRFFNYLNPASPFIIATRDLTTKGTLTQPDGLLWVSLAGLLIFLICWRIFHLAMTRIAERV
jgi:ABC-type polysaccharide/polyol phosphate export permease